MWHIELRRDLDDKDRAAVEQLVLDAADHDGFRSLSDHLWLKLANRTRERLVACLAVDDLNRVLGCAQLSEAHDSTIVEIVIAPEVRADTHELVPALLQRALEHVAEEGGSTVTWWVHHPDATAAPIAASAGLRLGRRLLQMRCALPIPTPPTVATRSFEVDRDEAEWLRVNNAAFHDHPEQGGWTLDTLRQREGESWFDPAGFRLHERDGRLAAFCWTKIHADADPPMGEIYVIAVDPQYQGLGLGKALTAAGLHHLASRGLEVGMLYVDAANTAAVSLYSSIGFTIHHEDHAFTAKIEAA